MLFVILGDFDTQQPTYWPQVYEHVAIVDLLLVCEDELGRTASEGAIINMNDQDKDMPLVIGNKDAWVCLHHMETKVSECT